MIKTFSQILLYYFRGGYGLHIGDLETGLTPAIPFPSVRIRGLPCCSSGATATRLPTCLDPAVTFPPIVQCYAFLKCCTGFLCTGSAVPGVLPASPVVPFAFVLAISPVPRPVIFARPATTATSSYVFWIQPASHPFPFIGLDPRFSTACTSSYVAWIRWIFPPVLVASFWFCCSNAVLNFLLS